MCATFSQDGPSEWVVSARRAVSGSAGLARTGAVPHGFASRPAAKAPVTGAPLRARVRDLLQAGRHDATLARALVWIHKSLRTQRVALPPDVYVGWGLPMPCRSHGVSGVSDPGKATSVPAITGLYTALSPLSTLRRKVTGIISGTPTDVCEESTHTVTARNARGEAQVKLTFQVIETVDSEAIADSIDRHLAAKIEAVTDLNDMLPEPARIKAWLCLGVRSGRFL